MMKVSICVPIYCVEKYIENCIRSLFEQTYDDIEYIFVDDCSLDKSISIINGLVPLYPNRINDVHIIRHNKNEGVAVARNTAIDSATGDFIYFVDADDYIERDTIACLVEEQVKTSADIVTARIVINENIIDDRFVEPIYDSKEKMLIGILSCVWHHELCNRLIRRSLFIDNNVRALPQVNICEDWQLVSQVVYYSKKCVTVDRPFYHYIDNCDSITHSNTNWEKEKKGYLQELLSMNVLLSFFSGTMYEKYISELFVKRQSDNIDLCVLHHDKDFFAICRNSILSVDSQYRKVISKIKLLCILRGFTMTRFFIYLHNVKKRF